MMEETRPLKKIAIFGHQKLPDIQKVSIAIAAFLNEKGVETQQGYLYDETIYRKVKQGEFDL